MNRLLGLFVRAVADVEQSASDRYHLRLHRARSASTSSILIIDNH